MTVTRTACVLALLAAMLLVPRHFPATAMGSAGSPDIRAVPFDRAAIAAQEEPPAQPVEQHPAPADPPAVPVLALNEHEPKDSNAESRTGSVPEPVWRQRSSPGQLSGSLQERATAPDAPTRSGGTTAAASNTRPHLFQTAAFRGNFDALPKWKRVLSKVKNEVRVLNSCQPPSSCPPGTTSWQRIIKQARGREPAEQLKMVNSFFNKWPYRLDQDVYGVSDWWATPQEFLKLSGDCEDYAITKYFALRELGFSQEDLRIVVLKDRIRGIGHAVLVVFLHGDAFVLDNITDAIFGHGKYRHYVPQYSLNEEYRWSHIPLAKQP